MTDPMNAIAIIQANLQQAMEKNRTREQTVKFEFDGQVRACCLNKPFNYKDLLKSIQTLFALRNLSSIESIQYLKQILAITNIHGTPKLHFILTRKLPSSPDSSPPPGTTVRRRNFPIDRVETSNDGGCFIPESKNEFSSSGNSSLTSRDSTRISERSSNASSISSKSSEENFSPTSSTYTPSNWKLGRQLGQGAFGKVFLCYDVDTGSEFAVKQIPLRGFTSQSHREMRILERELEIYKELHHERIVRFFGAQRTNDQFQIFMEYMTGGSVREQILNYGPLTESVTRKYTKQIVEGLIYLHENRFVHRDIKCANVLRDIAGNIKLGDFGTSKRVMAMTHRNQPDSGTIGTAHWTAPEIIQGNISGRRADIWSLGCTIVEMLTMGPPWQHLEPIAAIFHIATCVKAEYELPAHVSKTTKDFVDLCLIKDYRQRPRAIDLIDHEFFNDVCSHR